jgi:hypothetical protein
MKFFIPALLLFSLSVYGQSQPQADYHMNDGTARSGNPGTFTDDDANTLPDSKIQSGETAGVPDKTKSTTSGTGSSSKKEDESDLNQQATPVKGTSHGTGASSSSNDDELDMSTAPDSQRSVLGGEKVHLDDNREEEDE